ncbi:hypothetical protein [Alishewanella longhuensis]|nr:hypothetical protein [Alishewanella longhuensis]
MGKFETAVADYQRWQIVLDVLNASQVKTVYRNQPVLRAAENNTGYYFLGEEGGFTAYSTISVQDPARTSIYRLFKEEDPFNPGKWRLVYEEAILVNQLLRSADQNLPFNFRRILKSGLSDIEFLYYGYTSLEDRNSARSENAIEVIKPTWLRTYDGMTINLNPLSVKISIEQQVIVIDIPDTLDRSIMSIYSDV